MNRPRPENLELGSLQPALHLVSSEPALSGMNNATPTIKLSSAYEFPSPGSIDKGQFGKISSTEVLTSAMQQSGDNKLGLTNSIAVAESSDLSPSDHNGNGELSVTTSEAPEKLSVISSSTNWQSPLKSSMSSLTSGNIDLLSVLPIKTRFATLSISDSLMPPEAISFNSKRHNSLPIPGTIDHLSPAHALDNGKPNGKPNGKSSNGNLSVSQPNSPSHSKRQSPLGRLFGKRKTSTAMNGYSSAGEQSDASCFSINSQEEEQLGASPKQRLQSLVKTVRSKMRRVGKNEVAPAPLTLLAPPQPAVSFRKRLDSFAPSSVADSTAEEIHFKGLPCCRQGVTGFLKKIRPPSSIDPLGNGWLSWLFIVALAYIYNAIVIFLRCSFPVQTTENVGIWFFFDYMCDAIYISDMLLRMRLIFFENGLVVDDAKQMRKTYLRTNNFKYDLVSLIPLDIFYLLTGVTSSAKDLELGKATASILLRLPRLLKVTSYVEFVEKYENKTTSPNIFRVVQSVGYLLYMIHLNTCCYYVVSVWEGIGFNDWVYQGDGIAYIRCLYRAAKTLITIGNLPPPETLFEIFFMNMDFLIGIFVFATIIGQMRDIVGNAGAARGAFRQRMDNTMALLKHWKIPTDIQNRVRLWYMYSWDRKELVDELEAIKGVPIKMQTDLAIHVHMGTLSKVSLFQDCDKMLLRDLVLKLRPVLYLPGDYICRKGEVGKEMFIIKSGCVQVVGGENNRTVLATLHSGSYFGEISLLAVGVGNRRTADVYSPGYANLFLLDKKVLNEVVINYPDAQESLKKKAREILKKNQANEDQNKKKRGKSLIAESILKRNGPATSPAKFFSTVLAAARNQKISSTILKGSIRSSMGSEGSLAKFSASDFSSDDELFNNPPRRRRLRRKKSRRRSKSATPRSTNVDVHAAASDSDALSAAEKGAYDNKGYLSTDADEKRALHQTSTEEAIADILEDPAAAANTRKHSKEKKEKKPTLQKQCPVDETDDHDTCKIKPTPLEQFSFDDAGWSSKDDDKTESIGGRQFTFDENDEDYDGRMSPLRQFTFDELDEMSREEDGVNEMSRDEDGDKIGPLKQFTFDEMDELEDVAIPPLRQFTFDDSGDSENEIEEHVRKMSRDTSRSSNPDHQETSTRKEPEEESDSASSKGGAKEEERRISKPKMGKAHAERIRIRQRRSKGSRGSIRSMKSLRSKRDGLGKSGKKLQGLDESKDGNRGDASSQDFSLSLSWDDTDDDKKIGDEENKDSVDNKGGSDGRKTKENDAGSSDRKTSTPQRKMGLIRRLPPISMDLSLDGSLDVGDKNVDGKGQSDTGAKKKDDVDKNGKEDKK